MIAKHRTGVRQLTALSKSGQLGMYYSSSLQQSFCKLAAEYSITVVGSGQSINRLVLSCLVMLVALLLITGQILYRLQSLLYRNKTPNFNPDRDFRYRLRHSAEMREIYNSQPHILYNNIRSNKIISTDSTFSNLLTPLRTLQIKLHCTTNHQNSIYPGLLVIQDDQQPWTNGAG